MCTASFPDSTPQLLYTVYAQLGGGGGLGVRCVCTLSPTSASLYPGALKSGKVTFPDFYAPGYEETASTPDTS